MLALRERKLVALAFGVWAFGAWPVAGSAKDAGTVIARSLPATSGVHTVAETVLEAPAAKVAAMLAAAGRPARVRSFRHRAVGTGQMAHSERIEPMP